jgi:hypothetical protein
MPLRLEGDFDKPFLDGARPADIAAERPLLATRHFHEQDTSIKKVRDAHDPNRGDPKEKPAELFQKRLREGYSADPITKRAAKGDI